MTLHPENEIMAKQRDERDVTVAIVASEFNYDVTLLMLERAKEEIAFLGVRLGPVVRTPGVFDLPLAAQALCRRSDVDAVVAIGAVIRGRPTTTRS
ncbi:6,7-dimethyl-8-ribityllumazine synthase [mine drainage metagenome]|uniref:6,7-dimethyl-8-ribityllumazine synthase n=1 Tax=mine drainage metagenome TaxID=410659 RepID=T1ACM4_9ZZZZ